MVTPESDTDDDTELYLIYDGQRVKVGISNNPQRRVSQMQTANPDVTLLRTWEVDNARNAEQAVHSHLNVYHADGEWFNCDPSEAQDTIRDVLSEEKPDSKQTELSSYGVVG
jgi:hypothetical protein